MKSSRRGTQYAVLGYVLIAAVVLGGMTWATVLSWRLARLDALNERAAQTREALWRMDGHLGSVLASEAKREYDDYVAIRRPDTIWSQDFDDLNPNQFRQPSPLSLYGPPYDWIELYFQVNQYGVWSSPYLPNDIAPWPQDTFVRANRIAPRARSLLRRLKETLPLRELETRLQVAMDRIRRTEPPVASHARSAELVLAADTGSDAKMPRQARVTGEFHRRNEAQQGLQAGYVPPAKCVPGDIVERNFLNTEPPTEAPPCECSRAVPPVEVSQSPLVGFWLPAQDDNERRLAFVRTVYADNQVLHQGFIADWSKLKPELLGQIEDLFPQADLEPSNIDAPAGDVRTDLELSPFPAVLCVPDGDPIAAAQAWRSVRGVLFASWTVAIGILLAAGWGVWNLVALTERRLQFAYAVTHELRTPLTTFRLYSDLLSAGLVAEDSRQEYYETLNRESERLSNLVEDVLEYARLESQQLRFNPVEIKGDALLAALAESFEQRCRSNGIESKTNSTTSSGKTLRTDVDMVRQITGVLVNNACRHARSSDKPAMLLELGSENGTLHIDVVDSGPGIERADARRIFRPFRRGRKAEVSAHGGVGLGLALARNWASLLGGRLQLVHRHHPQYGGAHFRLTLPAKMPNQFD